MSGYMYIPVAYNAYLFKDLMQHKATCSRDARVSSHLG